MTVEVHISEEEGSVEEIEYSEDEEMADAPEGPIEETSDETSEDDS